MQSMSTTREESADSCQRTGEGQCGSEAENRVEWTQVDTSQHDVIKIIGIQSPFIIKSRLSCTLLDEDLQDEAEGESQNSSASSEYSGEECAEMLAVGGIIYHLEEITTAIINTMTEQEKSLYNKLLEEYNTCYI